MSALEELKQAIADALALVSDHASAISTVKATVAAIRESCPDLQLGCVFRHISVGGGAYAPTEAESNAAALLLGLSDVERVELVKFIEARLIEAEQAVLVA